jgi:hypothetical protein
MARSEPPSPRRDDDLESEEAGYFGNLNDVEAEPLLATDVAPDLVPDKAFQRTVIIMSYVFIFLVEIYAFLTAAPMQNIMEDFICHSHFPDHVMNEPRVQDQRCKEADVQRVLAMVKSWTSSVELLVRTFAAALFCSSLHFNM